MGAATDNDTARKAMNLLYNQWFTYWRDRIGTASDEEWIQCLDEGNTNPAQISFGIFKGT